MFVRKMLAAVTVAGLAMSAAPASADEGLGVGTQIAGAVAAVTAALPGGPQADDDRVGTPELVGKCTYVGVTTLNGRIQFAFGGAVESYSTDPTRQPQATQAVCRLESTNQPGVPGSEPTYNQTTSIALAGAVAPTPPALTVPLQLRPVNICVSGFGVYGPNTEGNPKFLIETCSTNAL